MIESQNQKAKKRIKPKDMWILCRSGKYLCYENLLYSDDLWLKFDEPILSISVDEHILLRLKSMVVLVDKDGNILWTKKIKSSAVCIKDNLIVVAKNKEIFIFDLSGKKIHTIKLKGKVNCIDISDGLIFAGSEKGVHCIRDEEVIWEINLGEIYIVRVGEIVVASTKNELITLSRDGIKLWRHRFDRNGIICEIETSDKIKVSFFGGEVVTLTFEGEVVGIEKEGLDRFLHLPWVTLKAEIENLKAQIKEAKKIKLKSIKKIVKKAEKLLKKSEYSKAHELVIRAVQELKNLQLQINIPKKVSFEQFTIIIKFYNFFDDPVDHITVDLTDLYNYFELSESLFDLPQIRKGMYIKKEIKATPKYEGKFYVKAVVKCNFGEFQKEFRIDVKKKRFRISFPFWKREEKEEETLLDLLK